MSYNTGREKKVLRNEKKNRHYGFSSKSHAKTIRFPETFPADSDPEE